MPSQAALGQQGRRGGATPPSYGHQAPGPEAKAEADPRPFLRKRMAAAAGFVAAAAEAKKKALEGVVIHPAGRPPVPSEAKTRRCRYAEVKEVVKPCYSPTLSRRAGRTEDLQEPRAEKQGEQPQAQRQRLLATQKEHHHHLPIHVIPQRPVRLLLPPPPPPPEPQSSEDPASPPEPQDLSSSVCKEEKMPRAGSLRASVAAPRSLLHSAQGCHRGPATEKYKHRGEESAKTLSHPPCQGQTERSSVSSHWTPVTERVS